MTPDDLDRFVIPGDPQIHPDGVRVAFTTARADVEQDRYDRAIWIWDGDEARAFTHGPSDSYPRWSPDGRRLAFLRKEEGDDRFPQVAVMAAEGGEARCVTDFPLGATELAWSPDGSRLAVVGTTWIEDVGDLDDEERQRRPRRITRFPYRIDNDGWKHDRRSHLYVLDLDQPREPVCVTPGDHDDWGVRWHPRRDVLGFLSRRHPTRELDPDAQVFEVDLASGTTAPVTAPGMWDHVTYRSDGTRYLSGLEHSLDWPDTLRVYRMDGDTLIDLTGPLDRGMEAPNGPVVIDGGLLLMRQDGGRVDLLRRAEHGEIEVLVGGDRTVTGMSATPDGSVVAFTATDPLDPGELHLWCDGEERVLTDLNRDLRDHGGLVPTRHFTFERDGATVDAWLVVPAEMTRETPLLLSIHGGPTAQYGFSFFDEFQVSAGAGYAVVGCNPRGSSGRGRDWARAVVGAWVELESVDMLDLRAAVEAARAAEPALQQAPLGIMGGSYGGYATARIIAQDDRFASAVVERALLSWPSFSGTSDLAMYFDRMFLERSVDSQFEDLWRASPVAFSDRVSTPTLLLHSEEDYRCPIEQAEQLFAAYKRAGVPVEFLRFPGESHELSRSGKPKHRLERFRAILDWHDRHLRTSAARPWTPPD